MQKTVALVGSHKYILYKGTAATSSTETLKLSLNLLTMKILLNIRKIFHSCQGLIPLASLKIKVSVSKCTPSTRVIAANN